VYSANNPSYGINWGMLKRKFALATARTLMDDGFTKIAALGISEGAAGAIMAQAEQPVFAAIVADSSYANLEQLFMRSPSMSRLNPAFLSTIMWEAQFWFGRRLDKISPATDAANLGDPSLTGRRFSMRPASTHACGWCRRAVTATRSSRIPPAMPRA
jgi:hypothetical protein